MSAASDASDTFGGVSLQAFEDLPVGEVQFAPQDHFPSAVSMRALVGSGVTESPEGTVWAYLFPAAGAAKYASLSLQVNTDGEYVTLHLDEVKSIISLEPVFEPIKAAPPRFSAFLKFCFMKRGVDCVSFTNNIRVDLLYACKLFQKAPAACSNKRVDKSEDTFLMPPPTRRARAITTPPRQVSGTRLKLTPGLRDMRLPDPRYSNASSVTLTESPLRLNYPALATSNGTGKDESGSGMGLSISPEDVSPIVGKHRRPNANEWARLLTVQVVQINSPTVTKTAPEPTYETMTDIVMNTETENGVGSSFETADELMADPACDAKAREYVSLRQRSHTGTRRVIALNAEISRMQEEVNALKKETQAEQIEMKGLRDSVNSVEEAFKFGAAVERASRGK
ncbi:hypothetical protein K491DRAFT_721899 [Lophiostoma macrostomum CBS 122681]|uniref:Uncharacterized protein n=1 Tax=Lophiostoma macrostomum CBS 122681 TaxID=1314788 RepID=A0A6A6SMV3_9PLEO|nr:hypothetical protein K491DRAFT_721899 [Lophiostoma macrostomum CBS 122681]